MVHGVPLPVPNAIGAAAMPADHLRENFSSIKIHAVYSDLTAVWNLYISMILVVILAILNDGTILTTSRYNVVSSPHPNFRKLHKVFISWTTFGLWLTLSTIALFEIINNPRSSESLCVSCMKSGYHDFRGMLANSPININLFERQSTAAARTGPVATTETTRRQREQQGSLEKRELKTMREIALDLQLAKPNSAAINKRYIIIALKHKNMYETEAEMLQGVPMMVETQGMTLGGGGMSKWRCSMRLAAVR
ncbi:unnamed protein product [Phytophthora fragariaefolia]|uniref:Unnamed protein product n=1 Tax=Phytophthora fragariaefolia TaxID=1490495 RepID=A0A9W7CYP6_9STRA|nr:unnamed protein product [Phytophthora fragariaefolia]